MTTIHLPAGEGRPAPMTDGLHVAKAAVRDDEGAFEMFEVIASPGPMAPPHVSPWSAVMYLVEGRVTASVDGTSYDVGPGDVVVFPAGTPSTFAVVEDAEGEGARFVAVTSGTRAGSFFADFAESVPLDQPLEASIDAIMGVARRHGVALAGA